VPDQVVALGLGFNPFRDHFEAEVVRQGQGGGADLGIAGAGFDIADESAVELEHLDGQALSPCLCHSTIASFHYKDG